MWVCKDKLVNGGNSKKTFVMMSNHVLYLVLFVVFSICSSTLLWRIETSPPSYIFGTIHVSQNLVWPYVSNETRQAFKSSTHFYAEIDAKNEAYWDDFLQCLVNRSTRIPRSTNSFAANEVLDIHLLSEARHLNKTIGSLESAEYQCELVGGHYNLTTWMIILDSVKKEMKNHTSNINRKNNYLKESLIKKYICEEITSQYIQSLFKKNDKKIHYLEQRDEQMAKHIQRLLHRSNTNRYFFAIGAAHMLGKHRNLIVQLKTFGFKITRVCTNRNRIKKKLGCKKKKIMKHCQKKLSTVNRFRDF